MNIDDKVFLSFPEGSLHRLEASFVDKRFALIGGRLFIMPLKLANW